MKICWDNLEKLRYNSKTRKWCKKTSKYNYIYYIEMESCKKCGKSFLSNNKKISIFCSNSCSSSGNNNPFYGKKHSNESKNKIGIKSKNRKTGRKNNLWKGGVTKKNIPLYDTYAHQIEYAEEVRRNKEDRNILEVKCTYCGKWYIPKRTQIQNRIGSLEGYYNGEARFYCSDECKQECPIYWMKRYSSEETNTKQYSREVQPELRQLVFKRDNWICQNKECKSKKNLHCHHIEGIRWIPLESADMDKCITYCKKCHKEVHSKEGCNYQDLKC